MTLGFQEDKPTKKFSLEDHVAATEAAKHNSDMANLASAIKAAQDGIKAHEKAITELADVIGDIGDVAAKMVKGEEQDLSIIQGLYDKAYERGERTKRITR